MYNFVINIMKKYNMVKKIRNASGTAIWNSQYLSLPWGMWVQILSVLGKGNKQPSAEARLGMYWACSEVQQGGSAAWTELEETGVGVGCQIG